MLRHRHQAPRRASGGQSRSAATPQQQLVRHGLSKHPHTRPPLEPSHTHQQLVRLVPHDLPILACPRLALVAVDHQVVRAVVVLRDGGVRGWLCCSGARLGWADGRPWSCAVQVVRQAQAGSGAVGQQAGRRAGGRADASIRPRLLRRSPRSAPPQPRISRAAGGRAAARRGSARRPAPRAHHQHPPWA